MSLAEITDCQDWAARAPGGLRLWHVDLDAHARDVPLDGLSAAEHARAGRMAFSRDARRYLASRHALRTVLSAVLGETPESIEIEIDAVDKPRLARHSEPHFNLSHSEQIGLIALSWGDAVGVDVEVIRSIADASALVWSHFSPGERARWAGVSEPRRDAEFFRCWTRKEACLKSLGVGLAAAPSSIDVSDSSCGAEVIVPLGNLACEVRLYAAAIPGDVVGAVALATAPAVTRARRYFQHP